MRPAPGNAVGSRLNAACTIARPAYRPVMQYLLVASGQLADQDETLTSCRLQPEDGNGPGQDARERAAGNGNLISGSDDPGRLL